MDFPKMYSTQIIGLHYYAILIIIFRISIRRRRSRRRRWWRRGGDPEADLEADPEADRDCITTRSRSDTRGISYLQTFEREG